MSRTSRYVTHWSRLDDPYFSSICFQESQLPRHICSHCQYCIRKGFWFIYGRRSCPLGSKTLAPLSEAKEHITCPKLLILLNNTQPCILDWLEAKRSSSVRQAWNELNDLMATSLYPSQHLVLPTSKDTSSIPHSLSTEKKYRKTIHIAIIVSRGSAELQATKFKSREKHCMLAETSATIWGAFRYRQRECGRWLLWLIVNTDTEYGAALAV